MECVQCGVMECVQCGVRVQELFQVSQVPLNISRNILTGSTGVTEGPTVKPSVSLLHPSSLQLSEGPASLLCLLSAYSPQGATVSWTVDGSVVNEGVLTSPEEQKKDGYTRSSTLTLNKALWEKGEEFVCHRVRQ
ncbi:immunoglobulin lambda-1 light chain-like isoform X2 [Silurus asotus]|nr:immunoglobulin lambda-1 light chain-like isoform X2 [Silurus asotus]